MSTRDCLDHQLHDIRTQQIADYQEKIRADRAERARLEQTAGTRHQREQEVLRKIGLDLEQLDQEQREAEHELGSYLEEARASVISRPSAQARDTKSHALLAELNAQAGHLVLPPYASTLFGANAGGLGMGPVGGTPPQFCVYFSFAPARTASYSMLAVLAFHGFYILRSDDGIFTSKWARVFLNAEMNVRQYVDVGLKSFPALIAEERDNADAVFTYDRTHFFDYTTVLKEGDPVTAMVTVLPRAEAAGKGSYAELNFKAGTANYIEPLFLSVALA